MNDFDFEETKRETATSIEVRKYPNGIEVEFFSAELPFYVFGGEISVVFTVGVPDGEYVIIGQQKESEKVDRLDAAIRWYCVDKNPTFRDFFYDKECKVRGSWSFVDAEEELAEILEWYQEKYPSGYFQPKQIIWPNQENRLPGEKGYSQGFDIQPILKAPSESSGSEIFKQKVNEALHGEKILVVASYGDWKYPLLGSTEKQPLLYRTFGMTDHGLSELAYFSTYPFKVAEKFLKTIAEQIIQNEKPEYETEETSLNTDVVLKEIDVSEIRPKQLEDWIKFFPLDMLRVTQVFEPDNNDRFPEDDGYNWENKPQPFLEDQ